MYQIRNLLKRTNVPLDPEKNMKAAEDFMLLLLHTHVIAAAKELLEYQVTDESLTVSYVAKAIVNTHLLLPNYAGGAGASADGITAYAKELLTLSLLLAFFSRCNKGSRWRKVTSVMENHASCIQSYKSSELCQGMCLAPMAGKLFF